MSLETVHGQSELGCEQLGLVNGEKRPIKLGMFQIIKTRWRGGGRHISQAHARPQII